MSVGAAEIEKHCSWAREIWSEWKRLVMPSAMLIALWAARKSPGQVERGNGGGGTGGEEADNHKRGGV